MRRLYVLLSLLLPAWVLAQSDTTMYVTADRECDLYTEVNSLCIGGHSINLKENSKVKVVGSKLCSSGPQARFLIVEYEGKKYFGDDYDFKNGKLVFNIINKGKIPDEVLFAESDVSKFVEEAKADSIKEAKADQKRAALLKRGREKGIIVMSWLIEDESEYTSGRSLSFQFLNPTSKTVKYIYVSVVGYNPVGDPVIERGKSTKRFTCVGPIKPAETGTYNFEYAWHTDLVEEGKITQIKVQYMDGSVKVITNPKDIIVSYNYDMLMEFQE